jgi:hypothetical protein
MEDHDGRTRYVERVVLPSRKSINVISFEPPAGTEVPPDISGAPEHPSAEVAGALGADQQVDLVHPVESEESGPEIWRERRGGRAPTGTSPLSQRTEAFSSRPPKSDEGSAGAVSVERRAPVDRVIRDCFIPPPPAPGIGLVGRYRA